MSDILYITSFNDEIYEASAKHLIASYDRYMKNDNEILYCVEDIKELALPAENVNVLNLDKEQFLQKWLEKNEDIIPDYLGGLAKPCTCKKPFDRNDKRHVKGCYFNWWNRNCSRWFRKLACLNHAIYFMHEWNYWIWIDSDCVFKKELKNTVIENLMKNYDIAYMRGKLRRAPESGIFIIKNNDYGNIFIKIFIDIYLSGSFRNEERWDDGYIFKVALKKCYDAHTGIKALDLARDCNNNEVANFTPLTPYIIHNKGTHGKKLGIMK